VYQVKNTLWEGGVRGAACVFSPRVARGARVAPQRLHFADWLPTLYHAAGGDTRYFGYTYIIIIIIISLLMSPLLGQRPSLCITYTILSTNDCKYILTSMYLQQQYSMGIR
jgi:hypothetical protein